jgi:hypothetical protein
MMGVFASDLNESTQTADSNNICVESCENITNYFNHSYEGHHRPMLRNMNGTHEFGNFIDFTNDTFENGRPPFPIEVINCWNCSNEPLIEPLNESILCSYYNYSPEQMNESILKYIVNGPCNLTFENGTPVRPGNDVKFRGFKFNESDVNCTMFRNRLPALINESS